MSSAHEICMDGGEVGFRYGGYDESIKAAVRTGGTSSGDDEFVVPRWARAASTEALQPTVEEQVAAGLRRGRSHRDAPLLSP